MSCNSPEIFQTFGLLLLFDKNRSELPFRQICEGSSTSNVPLILHRLQLLETGRLLRKGLTSGRVVWKITPLGRSIRDKVREIIDSIS